MFDAEKLLGTLMREVVGSGSGYGKKKKKKKHGNALINNLKSGTGLMTAIGLGIGAYEILRSKSQPQTGGYGQTPPMVPPPPPAAGRQAPAAPQPSPGPPPLPSAATVRPASFSDQDLAQRMIQVMIAAAHADGTMDEQEEQAVLDRLKGESISQEERMYLLNELHNPKSIEQLTAGIADPTTARAMYMLAVSTVDIDTEAERHWFDQLAERLGLSKAIQSFIEEQA